MLVALDRQGCIAITSTHLFILEHIGARDT